jgi:hypothetical protein
MIAARSMDDGLVANAVRDQEHSPFIARVENPFRETIPAAERELAHHVRTAGFRAARTVPASASP